MKRVTGIVPAGQWQAGREVDHVMLAADERQRRRAVFTGEKGYTFLLDLEKPVVLHDGDGLVLEDGGVVRIAGMAEALVEVRPRAVSDLARLAWHIGNRHTDLQIVGETLRVRRDHVLEDMLRGLGAELAPIEAAFEPEVVPAVGALNNDGRGRDE
ncbi:MAG TPA: urease accessory protein UreE [Xanthobacteraceae bacterium]|nr:urease accessory protein UreE [Xanthobacteraceae bacterium]